MAVFAIYSSGSLQKPTLAQQAEAVAVREGFSFWALVIPLIWCLYHRTWRPLVALVVLGTAIELAFGDLGFRHAGFKCLMEGVLAVFVGFSAADFRGAALQRRGFDLVNVVVAEGEDQALLRHLEQGRVLQGAAADLRLSMPVPPAAAASSAIPADLARSSYRKSAILGLFPEARR